MPRPFPSWDERFHALVAKNCIEFPFKPMLRANPILPVDHTAWCCNSLWLHKQPLFMWQIALSMKIFGVSTFALRLPSVIMGTLMILLVFKIAIRLTSNRNIALIAACLMCFSHFQLEQIAGAYGMDHNDVAFNFYILCSIWCLVEYLWRANWQWAALIGLFAGMAILNKWLTGLVVFAGWAICIFYIYSSTKKLEGVLHFILALIVCVIVFLPWQIFILNKYPIEANFEYKVNTQHIYSIVQGHAGSIFYYIKHLHKYFGIIPCIILIFTIPRTIYKLWKQTMNNIRIHITLLSIFFIIYLFFSVIVKTKLPSYVFIVAPLGCLYIAMGLNYISSYFKIKKIILLPILLLLILDTLRPDNIISDRKSSSIVRNNQIFNTQIYKSLYKLVPNEYKVIINLPSYQDIDCMFYNNNKTAYQWYFTQEELAKLEKQKIKIAAFASQEGYTLPDYYASYPYLYSIPIHLR